MACLTQQGTGRMASRQTATARPGSKPHWRDLLRQGIARILALVAAVLLALFTLFLALALVSHHGNDPSWHTAAGGPPLNWMGYSGAWVSGSLLFAFGLAAPLMLPLLAVTAGRLWRGTAQPRWHRQAMLVLVGMVLVGVAAALWMGDAAVSLPAGWGGLTALLIVRELPPLFALAGDPAAAIIRTLVVLFCLMVGLALCWRSLALPAGWLGRLVPDRRADLAQPPAPIGAAIDPDHADAAAPRPRKMASPVDRPAPRIAERPAPASPKTPPVRQSEMFSNYQLPPIALLDAGSGAPVAPIDKASLERNARLLETVLEDFQVKGAITAVRPGPVVTMYELEPAPGTKASRVSNLADDIARNMSALSARIAPIPGRTVIGIELPNAVREPVVLHEMISSAAFQEQRGALPIILGKNISGDPVITDLAPMPHLLIAGTTGSGKSVGLNAMILSLLYRLGPDQIRLILIDPKMLELSVYDGIPHLLAPVVTEPGKAVRALKWAVEQMEDRYRMMSSLSVRNLASYNDKVRTALAKGKALGRRVQTGYDPDTGQPVYEEETLDYQPLPQIVVVVDELADLMMTAGKEVEFLIQRLAQKARAAGIHLILATQRPSVDVITGVIKANLPTRISFNVTSKIDSRTILGEAGAEQLLGKGDMLYVPGGKQMTRIHGPFVSDDEVRAVADHWRAQGQPDYVEAVTEEPEDGGFALDGAPSGDTSSGDRMYDQARQIVIESQKASISWLQRQMRVGYNTSARMIDQLEDNGVISAPNHVGRREVLLDRNGNPH